MERVLHLCAGVPPGHHRSCWRCLGITSCCPKVGHFIIMAIWKCADLRIVDPIAVLSVAREMVVAQPHPSPRVSRRHSPHHHPQAEPQAEREQTRLVCATPAAQRKLSYSNSRLGPTAFAKSTSVCHGRVCPAVLAVTQYLNPPTAFIFGRGYDSAIWYRTTDGNKWTSEWQSLGGNMASQPASRRLAVQRPC